MIARQREHALLRYLAAPAGTVCLALLAAAAAAAAGAPAIARRVLGDVQEQVEPETCLLVVPPEDEMEAALDRLLEAYDGED